MSHCEAEYEVVGKMEDKTIVKIYPEGRREPIRHGISDRRIAEHPDGARGAIEEAVERIACRCDQHEVDLSDVPKRGTVEYQPGVEPGMEPADLEDRRQHSDEQ